MSRGRPVIALVFCAIAVGHRLAAQESRTVNVSRQLRDSAATHLWLEYGAGHLEIHPTSDPLLFDMRLRYNDDNGSLLHQYNAAEHTLRLGVNGQSIRVGKRMSDETSGEMNLALSRAVPFDLQLDVGAAKADVELGGLMLTDARIHAGASDLTIGFNVPNVARLRSLDIDVGAASLEANGLANSNTSAVVIKSGVGDVTLSFDGSWTQSMSLDATVAIGKLTVRIPKDVGVRVEAKHLLASFDHPGLDKGADGFYYSSNWDSARFKLRVRAETVLGAIEIDRTLK